MAQAMSEKGSEPRKSRRAKGRRERWLVLFNCQAFGLANCLELICPDIEVEFYDLLADSGVAAKVAAGVNAFDRILVAPRVESISGIDFGADPKVWRVPHLLFSGYHPDLCHLRGGSADVKGPVGPYHSLIAYAAFRCGLSESQALDLYREEVFAALGYFHHWDAARDEFLATYRHCGWDIGPSFVQWSRAGPFMYVINHPKIRCLYDLAGLIIERAGFERLDAGVLPHDNLANGQVFPVYPEIGLRLGVRGAYLFKRGGKYQCMYLDEFISRSFAAFRSIPDLVAHPAYVERASAAVRLVESGA